DVEKMNHWHEQSADAVAHIMASELGVPMRLIQDQDNPTPLGDAYHEGPRIPFARMPGHFIGLLPEDGQPLDLDLGGLQPLPMATIDAARDALAARLAVELDGFTEAWAVFAQVLERVPEAVRAQALHQADGFAAYLETGLSEELWNELAAPIRAQSRIDATMRAV